FILAACSIVAPEFLVVVKFLVETGCRKSEAINLPWTRVDFERRVVRIWNGVAEDDDEEDDEEEGDDDDDSEYEVKSVEREVTLPDALVLMLKAQKLKVGASEWVFPVRTNRMHTKSGRYAQFPKHTWARVLVKANELAKKANPGASKIAGGPHRCRHTFASHFLSAKPDLFALARVLGHGHSRVTELYAHLLDEHLATTRNVVTFEAAIVETAAASTPATTPGPSRRRRAADDSA
ncbi:MAG TPA: site-specific integrase, partial [Polyangiaceae bacterium]